MCDHSEVSQATSADWESVCAECGETLGGIVMKHKFWFVSGANATSRMGVTVLEAWRMIQDDGKRIPLPAWLRTDAITATDVDGKFLKVQHWAKWEAELAEADRQDADETSECDWCQGTGFGQDEDGFKVECTNCGQTGRVTGVQEVYVSPNSDSANMSENWR